jgi:hypothetical protein
LFGRGDFGGSVGKGKQTKFYFRPNKSFTPQTIWFFVHTKPLGTHQVKASLLGNHPIVFEIIKSMIINDWLTQGRRVMLFDNSIVADMKVLKIETNTQKCRCPGRPTKTDHIFWYSLSFSLSFIQEADSNF